MDVREAVKKKENYGRIVNYFRNLGSLDIDQMILLIDIIGEMSEEIFEHYRAMQLIFRDAVHSIIRRRNQEGGFTFLSETQRQQLAWAMEKAGQNGAILAEKYESYIAELKAA